MKYHPDELGYLATFKNLYIENSNNPQFASGWIAAPLFFLRLIYLPAKIFELTGIPSLYAIRLVSILFCTLALYVILSMFNIKNFNKNIIIIDESHNLTSYNID